MMDFLPNIKTFAGLALLAFGTLAGMYHWEWWSVIAGDVEILLNQTFQAFGLALGIYGKIMAIRRERALKAELEVAK